MAWGKAGSTTLSSAGDNIDVTGFADNKFIIYLNHNIPTGSMTDLLRIDGNSGSNYAFRYNNNGTSETTAVNQDFASYLGWTTNTNQSFSIGYIANISTEEKIGINHSTDNHDGTGAGTAPNRRQSVFKLADTTNSVDEINIVNTHTGSFDTDSNLTVLGSDLTPAAAVTFPTNVQVGSRAEITDTRKIYFRADSDRTTDKWFEAGTAFPTSGLYAVFGGGYIGSNTNVIDYITVATTGNATDFGDMNTSRRGYGTCASMTRGLFAGGYASNYTANIEYITIATPSNGTSFGSLSDTQTMGIMGAGSETRGLFAGGESGYTNRIDYVTIASTGNATDFGDLTAARKNGSSTSDGTKAVFFGGENSQTTLDYVTIATTGNASSWGGSFSTGSHSGGIGNVNNGTRGVIAIGGSSTDSSYSDIIVYLTMTTGSNSTDFGNLSQGRATPSQASTDTRGVFGGGKFTSGGSSGTVTIDYITIATTGNATDFGDLTQARYAGGAVSDQGGDRT